MFHDSVISVESKSEVFNGAVEEYLALNPFQQNSFHN